jgi:hypothetical protein
MFGFGNNPDSETLEIITRNSEGVARLCMYMYQKNAIPPNDGDNPLSLIENDNKEKILTNIDAIINENKLYDDTTDKINSICIQKQNNKTDIFYENALCVIVMLNTINIPCKMYYVDFPKSKKLLELVNSLTKIASPAFINLFGNYPPNSVRKCWPHFSSIFEDYNRNG